jgi:hypothetical protein
LKALDMIVQQGEGATAETLDCHLARFRTMRQEWPALEARHLRFSPPTRQHRTGSCDGLQIGSNVSG